MIPSTPLLLSLCTRTVVIPQTLRLPQYQTCGGGGGREEVSLILRRNWSLPTVHMGHTPYMGCFPFQWWVGGGRLAEADPPVKWDKIPISLVGGRRKRRRLTHHSNGIQSHFTGGWLAEGYNSQRGPVCASLHHEMKEGFTIA